MSDHGPERLTNDDLNRIAACIVDGHFVTLTDATRLFDAYVALRTQVAALTATSHDPRAGAGGADEEAMMDRKPPVAATVLSHRDDSSLANTVGMATADTSIVLGCPSCETFIRLGPRTGRHNLNLPWLTELCPTCGARFRVVQRIEITWQP